jgi:uncharacterized membrane protein YdjX (TVP38/TMEM64 family)
MPGQRRFPRPPRLLWVLGAWAMLIGSIQLYAWQATLSPGDLLAQLMLACHIPFTGPLLLLGVMLVSVGLLYLRVETFVLANTLSSLPGVILIVLLGSAAGDLGRDLPMVPPLWLTGALILLAVSIALAIVLRQRKGLSQ